jgi:hypothetical protein
MVDSSIGIATDYGLNGGGSFLGRGKQIFFFSSVQANSGGHPTSNPIRSGALSLGIRRQGMKLTPTSNAAIKK